jgi:hypothetical protein
MMCDTLYKATTSGFIFGKNSDRSPNEPNLTVFFPRKENSSKKLKCTYIEIPQVNITNACLLVKPSWMWGAEMGVNEYGVTIGNEAIFTKSKGKKIERLTGMDLLRLALERSNTALEAVTTITSLLDTYGQGGNCGFDKSFYYDNSFLICDDSEAYILETSSKEWALTKIHDNANISNRISIHEDFVNTSENNSIDFFKEHTEPIFTHFSGSFFRQASASCYLNSSLVFNVQSMMDALKSHEPKDINHLYQKGSIKSVCMHKSLLGDHTTSSMIVSVSHQQMTIWLTSASTPCLSLYKPVYFGINGSVVFNKAEKAYDYWLNQEYLHRTIFSGAIDEQKYLESVNSIQKSWITEEEILRKANPTKDEQKKFMQNCLDIESKFIQEFTPFVQAYKNNEVKKKAIWKKLDRSLGHNVFEKTLDMRLKK